RDREIGRLGERLEPGHADRRGGGPGADFAVARYGLSAVFGLLLWLAVRDRARPWPWGAFTIAALMVGLAIAVGVAELGELSHALWAAAIQLFVWVHASGRAV